MRSFLKKIDQKTLRIIREIGCEAEAQGVRAFIVGGFVRDLILGRPNKDLDIVVEFDAISFARKFAKKKKLAIKTHQRFGTAVIEGWNSRHVDFVTARSETYAHPGALPQVKPSHIINDLVRRDFTMNALAIHITPSDFGEYCYANNGFSDLKRGIIRVFHDNSFKDDPTRILRAIRFEQRFGFRLEAKTRRLLKEAIAKRFDRAVSPPRYFQEFARGLMEPYPSKYLRRLSRVCALDFLGIRNLPDQRVFNRLEILLLNKKWSERDRKVFYISALYSGLDLEKIFDIAKNFQWARNDKKDIMAHIKALQRLRLLLQEKADRAKIKKFLNSLPEQTNLFIRALSSSKIVEELL